MKQYYVYIMSNRSRTLYTGITDNLERRAYEHNNHLIKGFTAKYDITRLVYYDVTGDVHAAIQREKQIKGWLRRKKVALIESVNPDWKDLAEEMDSSGCALQNDSRKSAISNGRPGISLAPGAKHGAA